MSRLSSHLIVPCFLLLATFFCSIEAKAQQVKVDGGKPEYDMILSPQFPDDNLKRFKRLEWIQFEAKIRAQMSPMPRSKTMDKMTVKWYVAIKNPDRANTYLLLTKDVQHVNIPLDEDTYISIFISPSSIKRLTGGNRAGRGTVDLVGYEVLVNGVKVAEATNKSKVGWWNTASNKISRSDTVPLMSKDKTPFAPIWWDRYAEVFVPNR